MIHVPHYRVPDLFVYSMGTRFSYSPANVFGDEDVVHVDVEFRALLAELSAFRDLVGYQVESGGEIKHARK